MKIDFPIGSGGLLENGSKNCTMEPRPGGSLGESLGVTTSTLPETNITPENGGAPWKKEIPIENPTILRGYVSSRECKNSWMFYSSE